MAITHITTVSAAPGANGGSTSAIDTTGATCLVVSVAYYPALGGTPTVADSKGNTYLPLTLRASGGEIAHQLFYSLGGTVGAGHTFTVSGPSIYPAFVASAFAGVGSFESQSGATATSGTALATGSLTPTTNGALVVSGEGGQSATTPSMTGFTLTAIGFTGGANMQGAAAWQIQTTAAAINPTWGFSPSPGHQAAGSAVFSGAPAAAVHLTQAVAEVLSLSTVPQRVTQYVVEALSDNLPVVAPKDYTWQITDLTDADRWMTGLLVFPVGDAAPGDVPPTSSPTQVVIPMHVTTRVVLPSGVDAWGADCLCDE